MYEKVEKMVIKSGALLGKFNILREKDKKILQLQKNIVLALKRIEANARESIEGLDVEIDKELVNYSIGFDYEVIWLC